MLSVEREVVAEGAAEDSTCICALFPAVMFDIVQQASFLIDSLGLLNK